jgi:hypothetical protein
MGRRIGGAKYQSARVNSRREWSDSEPAQPFSTAGVQEKTEVSSSGPADPFPMGAVTRGREVGEGRPGGPATGTFDPLEIFAPWRPDALVDMLDLDLVPPTEFLTRPQASGSSRSASDREYFR